MIRASVFSIAGLFCFLALAGAPQSHAATCTAADFGEVVDQTAQALRELNSSGAERFQEKLTEYQRKHDLTDAEIRARAAALQDDNRMSEFNREIETLVSRMDALSQTPSEEITCEKLEELKRVRDRLLTVMGQKSGYMLAQADAELDRPAEAAAAEAPKQAKASEAETAEAQPEQQVAEAEQPAPAQAEPAQAEPAPADTAQSAEPKPEPAPEPKQAKARPALNPDLPERRASENQQLAGDWQTDSQTLDLPASEERETAYLSPEAEAPGDAPTSLAPQPDGEQAIEEPLPDETQYSIAEIREAGRGLFGPVTGQVAAAINYAFQNFGQPNGYIVGSEGSAAFLAGLRYGKGQLYTKTAPPREIYWQGPSLGYDLGAEGSDTLFLVYNLDDLDRIYGRFTGVGGSAYVAGGVGLNVMGKGDMVMVPIRTGIGLRLGANLAYLKFTRRQTWNPF